ncbi:hypothetical protein Scep_011280 [Stephania cephalantha]|uniref:Uncharacterized protein n=1 Tax=Stephania cephalantha TaxID=152367 RepID=A0AAP0P5E8_9MAGN
MILRALGSDQVRDYDSDDDFAVARLPLLRNPAQVPPCVVGEPQFIHKGDSWNVRIHDKVGAGRNLEVLIDAVLTKSGACGYGSMVDVKPFRARVGAVSPVLFKDGEGCGACYKVRCLDPTICSRRAVTVIITDECPGGYCSGGHSHFDLSGAAFGRLAVAGNGGELRNRGLISVIYRRTPCRYRGKNVAFHVNEGSTAYWLSLLVEFEAGEGDIGAMHIRPASSTVWMEMKHLWGANWCIIGGPLQGPFSVKITTLSTGRSLSAREVIPRNWSPKATYTSRLNFS